MIEKIDISNPSIAEVVRKQMVEATVEEKGLLSNTLFSILLKVMNGRYPLKSMSVDTDIDKLYLECDSGLSFYAMVSAAINVPGAGFLLHFQRLGKGDLTSGSFLVSQLCMLMGGEIKYRYGKSQNGIAVYSNWREI